MKKEGPVSKKPKTAKKGTRSGKDGTALMEAPWLEGTTRNGIEPVLNSRWGWPVNCWLPCVGGCFVGKFHQEGRCKEKLTKCWSCFPGPFFPCLINFINLWIVLAYAFLSGAKMAHCWHIWRATFSKFVVVIRPRINVACIDRNCGICVVWFMLWSRFIHPWLHVHSVLVCIGVFPLFLCHVFIGANIQTETDLTLEDGIKEHWR